MSVDQLVDRAARGEFGPLGTASLAFTTRQGVRHRGRAGGYRNEVLSVRVGAAVGSCAVEPGSLDDDAVQGIAGRPVADLLADDDPAVRVAALDAHLMSVFPHQAHATPVVVPAGDSLAKSLHRAATVVELLDPRPGQRVLVVGVVNSILHHLRARGVDYVPCDRKGGRTEWGEPIATDAADHLDTCDAVLATGMVLLDGLAPLLAHPGPLVLFAQTGSAVLPHFIGRGATAVSAEPYPFFWLDGGPSTLHQHRSAPA
ncbi:hypothetical protein [Actinokineospora bangkokensis]|uniref:Heavy-metal chelation domain-containing protein n=1 Tax=Actinokineospora bangkokensis TaxID=1193682 RepID=A0A1Q9LRG4_9PSEU|nr:hypothetical protein [Actinokineospora bangkokensis]OLR94612.1 hypothetical protein BJP25_12830 [Actinokineospora bangkokensis]